jgi:hypothetical protein
MTATDVLRSAVPSSLIDLRNVPLADVTDLDARTLDDACSRSRIRGRCLSPYANRPSSFSFNSAI